jgi:hypothetical protein
VVVVGLNFKKKVMLLLIITWLLSLTGCWDHLEVERLGIIGIIALDQAPEGKLRVTVQIINPKVLAGGGQVGGAGGMSASARPYRNVSAEGNTFVLSGCLLRKTGYGDDTSIYLPLYPEQSAAFPFIQPPGHPIAFKHCRAAHFYQHADCFRALFLSIAVRLSGKLFPYLGFIGFYLDSHGINISPVTLQVFQEVPELNIGIKRT